VPTAYDLTRSAKQDVRGIWVYTAEQWGERQADRYTAGLETCFRRIAGRRFRHKTFSERYPQVRVTRCQEHYVFYLLPEGPHPLIIAVLHGRMDLLARLGERLSQPE
jgi:toxin ParE1/3/4